jgi:hypothetical protein
LDVITGDSYGHLAWFENLPNPTVTLAMPSHEFRAGDPFLLQATISNPSHNQAHQVPLFIVLYLNGEYFFWPDWNISLQYQLIDILPGDQLITVIEPFIWPSDVGVGSGDFFFATLTNQEMTEFYGMYGFWEFGWES